MTAKSTPLKNSGQGGAAAKMLDDKVIIVTGGTGSFGNAVIEGLLADCNVRRIIVFSRDEKKQHDMRLRFNNPKLRFVIGDVRDRDTVFHAMNGVDMVFHAAALKHVPSCEFFPMETVKTNVIGTNNVLEAAEHYEVQKVVVLSTDKAVYPINAMGLSKALMEKLMIAKTLTTTSPTIFCGVRYGNVMYSRGSVIPLFVNQIKSGRPLTVTIPHMTRFLLPLPKAVDLVLYALAHGEGGDIFVRKAPASTIKELAQACVNIFGVQREIIEIGIREGEKIHETLVGWEELIRAEELDNYFRIRCESGEYAEYFTRGHREGIPKEPYTSANNRCLSIREIEELLLSLNEIQSELRSFRVRPA